MRRLLRRPYVFWVLGIFVAYMALNVTLSQFYITVRFMHYYAQTLNNLLRPFNHQTVVCGQIRLAFSAG